MHFAPHTQINTFLGASEQLQSPTHPVNKSVSDSLTMSQAKSAQRLVSTRLKSRIWFPWLGTGNFCNRYRGKITSGVTKGKKKRKISNIWLQETFFFDLIRRIHTYQANAHYARIVRDEGDLQNFSFIFTFCNGTYDGQFFKKLIPFPTTSGIGFSTLKRS